MKSKEYQKKGGKRKAPEKIRRVPKDFYRFKSNIFHFGEQKSRLEDGTLKKKPISYYENNHHYVYKSCEMLDGDQEKIDNLNDILFSHSKHPNIQPDWSLLFSIIAHQPEEFVCPICLFSPVAPRITKCGHVFCYDCILQHISTSKQPCLCPVCFQPITQESLIRCDLRLFSTPLKEIKMRKIIKNRHNCCCFENHGDENMKFLPTASQKSSNFSHFSIADPKYVSTLLQQEIDSLTAQNLIYNQPEYFDQRKLAMIETVLERITAEKAPETDEAKFFLEPPSDFAFFYQEINGRPIFMDSLSIKIFKQSFKNPKDTPHEFSAKVLKVTTQTVTQKFRRAYPMLGHLPSGIEVQFVLLDLSEIAPPQILAKYQHIIDERLKQDLDDDYDYEEDYDDIDDDLNMEEGDKVKHKQHRQKYVLYPEYQRPPVIEPGEFPDMLPTKQNEEEIQKSKEELEKVKSKQQKAWSSVKPTSFKKKTLDDEFPSLSPSFPAPSPNSSQPKEEKKPVQSAWGNALQVKRTSSEKINQDFPSLSQVPSKPKPAPRTSSWGSVSPK